jgi:iron complex transport system permease protein
VLSWNTHLFQYCWATTKFTFWSLGIWEFILDIHWILFLCVLVGLFLSLFSIKPLNALLLGENYARSLGWIIKNKAYHHFATSILGEYNCGPIAFIGLVPHIAKLVFRPVTTLSILGTFTFGRVYAYLWQYFTSSWRRYHTAN